MSDSEIDDIERFQTERDRALYEKAGLNNDDNSEFEFSDEEVMGIESGEDDDQSEYYEQGKSARAESTGWGASRNNYYGGDDYQEDEEALEDEEEEALRMQQAQMEEMDEGDFYDEDDMEGWNKTAVSTEIEVEELPQETSNMSAAERLAFIQSTYPEVLLLSKELQKCKEAAKDLESEEGELAEFQKVALNSYMGMIYSYFALFTSKVADGPVDLKEHPVMEGILKARELWRVATAAEEPMEELHEEPEDISADSEEAVSEIESDAESEISNSDFASFESEQDEDEDDFTIKLPKISRENAKIADYDEAADSIEQQARAKNKQSLRFYTSQIDKRSAVKEDKFQGDLDLPYKERAFERRQRLLEEARQRGQQTQDRLGESEDDAEDTEENHNPLYAEIKAEREKKKRFKVERHAEAVAAAKQGRLAEYLAENPNVDKRAINYQIQKNKGLTPKRKKENRNARVKKRVRFAAAQKKLKSVRRVYQEPSGPYGGEMSGIKKNLVHSTKFGG